MKINENLKNPVIAPENKTNGPVKAEAGIAAINAVTALITLASKFEVFA